MSNIINTLRQWINRLTWLKPWLWFVGLWLSGIIAMLVIASPIKWLGYLLRNINN